MRSLLCVVFVALCVGALADVYMHLPRGSNNRYRGDANNQNRLFDSQNNAAGGYCWGESMYFYSGSFMQVEWTQQHGCGVGHPNVDCNMVLQYMCNSTIRDGTEVDPIPDDPDIAVRDEKNGNGEYIYAMHESYDYYQACKARKRNNGLFAADRVLRGNLNPNGPATRTRQNNNGNRHGYECPEERDYYPYWLPTPWKDIAILTSDTTRCTYYQTESQNVKSRWQCSLPDFANQVECATGNGVWSEVPAWGIPAPQCLGGEWARDNHLGNTRLGISNRFIWVLPAVEPDDASRPELGATCIFRLRYNISTSDYNGFAEIYGQEMIDASNNDLVSPVRQNPNIRYSNDTQYPDLARNLTLAVDTTQFGRTFQDRSHIFYIKNARPDGVPLSARIFNVNVRGRRGNIVQTYPSVEYDFVPNMLNAAVGDYVHFQWTGCDTHNANQAGQGRDKTDNSNVVFLRNLDSRRNYPMTIEQAELTTGIEFETLVDLAYTNQPASYCDPSIIQSVDAITALEGQACCLTLQQLQIKHDNNAGNIAQDAQNCARLNLAKYYYDAGLIQLKNTGAFAYMSSRNNAFTNRSQKGMLNVETLVPYWGVAFLAVGGAGFAGALVIAIMASFAKSHPGSSVANFNLKI